MPLMWEYARGTQCPLKHALFLNLCYSVTLL